MNEDLRDWFGKGKEGGAGGGGWDRYNTKGERIGKCAREPGEPKPKCLSKEKAAKMGKEKIAAAVRRKRAKDPVADREGKGGKPKMVSNKIDEVRNAYAVGMAVAKKKYNDEPPLDKKTIKKAHEIAKSIKKDEKMEEAFERFQRLGKNYKVFFTFRGQYKGLDFFFPTAKRPSREDVKTQLHKIYPEAVLVNYFEREREEDKPVVHVEGAKSFGQFRSDSQQLNEFLPGTGRVVAGRSQRGANPAGGSRFTTAGTVQKVLGVTVPGSFRKGVSQSDVDRHNRRAPSNAQIKPTNKSDDQLMGYKPGGQTTVGITPDPKPKTPTRTASQSRAQSTSGYGKVGEIGNVEGNLRYIKDRSAEKNAAFAAAQRRARGLSNSYEPEGEYVQENNPRVTGIPNNPSALERIDAATPGPGAFTYHGFKEKTRKPYKYNNPYSGSNYDRSKTTAQQRREYAAGGGNAAMKDKGQTADQVRAQGRKNLKARPSNPNVHNWKDGKTKVYAGNPPMRFNVGEGRSVYGSGQLRPTDRIKMGDGSLKSLKDIDAELKKKKLQKESETIDEKSAAWTRKAGKNSEGGLNEKGRKSYEKENPGSDLKAPSKVKGNPRRKSFCARMKGMKNKLTSAKTANDPDSRINKSLRAWDC